MISKVAKAASAVTALQCANERPIDSHQFAILIRGCIPAVSLYTLLHIMML